MSNALAIAAVTATLRNLLAQGIAPDPDLADISVTMQPPDRARPQTAIGNQLNVFLYQAAPNPAWRNRDLPTQQHDGEAGQPPLALNLFYLLTAYGRDNDAQRPFSHMLLGRAMSILHDHPVLGAAEIAGALQGGDSGTQLERIRLTLQPMALEDMSKLWTAFQSQFRASVAYEAAVVLIGSTRPRRAAPPVLRRGEADTGASALGGTTPPIPTITAVEPAGGVEPGSGLTLHGHDLDGQAVTVLLSALLHRDERKLQATSIAADQVTLTLPADLPAGLYRLSLQVHRPDPRPSNSMGLTVVPAILSGLPARLRPAGGRIALVLKAPVLPGQEVQLLVGGVSLAAPSRSAPTDRLSFDIPALPVGQHIARLRVEGIDSAILADPQARLLSYDPHRLVTVAP
jgi:hypothetical protein